MRKVSDYLTRDVVLFMRDTIGEEEHKIEEFFDMIRESMSLDEFETVLRVWNQQDDRKQMDIATRYIGVYNISRFLMMMDYLYIKHIVKMDKQ